MNLRVLSLAAVAMVFAVSCSGVADSERERNVEVVLRQHAEIWSKGNRELIDEFFAENFVGHFPEGTVVGHEGIRATVLGHRSAFPDWTEEVEDVVAEGDRVVTRFRSRGTNLGQFSGRPATGKKIEITEVVVFRMQGGKISEQWVYPDMLSMQRQLGIVEKD